MKKIFGLILSAAVLGTVLTACGGSGAGVNIQPVAFLVIKDGCRRI